MPYSTVGFASRNLRLTALRHNARSRPLLTREKRHSDGQFALVGDFNQSRDGSRWYGTEEGRDCLTARLADAGLECATEADMVAAGKLTNRHLVDHIALSPGLARRRHEVRCWEPVDDQGIRMSDHPGVAVDVV